MEDTIVCHIVTGRCCGIVWNKQLNAYVGCKEKTKPQFGFAFCCEKHKRFVEHVNLDTDIKQFYLAVAVVNAKRPELCQRFYRHVVPHLVLAPRSKERIRVQIHGETESEVDEVLNNPYPFFRSFMSDIKADVKEVLRITDYGSRALTAGENSFGKSKSELEVFWATLK